MIKEIILTPEELYCIGRFLQAKYIDYAYVAAMADFKQDYELFEKEIMDGLIKTGFLMEDFSGNIEVDQQIVDLLNPIFFGENETSLEICDISSDKKVCVYKFHFFDGAITMVTNQEGRLLIKAVDQVNIKNIVEDVLSSDYNVEAEVVTIHTERVVTRFIAAKSILVGKSSFVKTYIDSEGVLYQENTDTVQSVSKDMFVSDVYEIVKGM